jgi:uncharacterized protein YndB with AHSA1/START domain
MWSAQHSIEINAAPEVILRVLADTARWPEWNAGTEWVELDGPFAAGTTARMKIPGEEPLTFRLLSVGPDGFEDETPVPDANVIVRVAHEIEPLADRRARVVYRATVEGPNAEALGPEIGPQVTADFPDVLAALKARAEASPRATI